MNISLPIENSVEFINITKINPFISKCEIKVCSVGDTPNRNGSVISKAVGYELGQSLPGSPIVGFYNEHKRDFEGHNQVIEISGNEMVVKETTRPYGFIDLNAKVWFQEFLDFDEVVREYLLTEGYLWTGQYPEAQRIIDRGNNQSMEIDEDTIKGYWTTDNNNIYDFFIINEAIISKLCILGENVEPCFEGSQIKLSFSHNFKDNLFMLLENMKQKLNEGGEELIMALKEKEEKLVTDFSLDFKEKDKDTKEEDTKKEEEDTKKEEEDTKKEEEDKEKVEKEFEEIPDKKMDEPEKGQKELFFLEENSIYVELKNKFEVLSQDYETLKSNYEALMQDNTKLLEFKQKIELDEKRAMIDSFSMLSDEEKTDIVKDIDKYSVNEIEEKLSVILVRNQKFNVVEETGKKDVETVFNISGIGEENTGPAWVSAARKKQKSL